MATHSLVVETQASFIVILIVDEEYLSLTRQICFNALAIFSAE